MKILPLTIMAILLLAGCSTSEEGAQPDKEKTGSPTQGDHGSPGKGSEKPAEPDPDAESPEDEPARIEDFLPKSQLVKSFKGTGNEFAAEKETLFAREGDFQAAVIENGGTRMLKIYQFEKDGIYLVHEQPEFYSDNVPAIDSFQPFSKKELLLPAVIKHNQVFNGWTVTSAEETVEVPFGEIQHAVVLSREGSDGSIIENIWAPGFGIIKKSFYLKDSSGNETKVLTELESAEPSR